MTGDSRIREQEETTVTTDLSESPKSAFPREADLPARVVVGANGAYWRDYGTHYSMCPVSEDNDPVVPGAIYVRTPLERDSRIREQDEPCQFVFAMTGAACGEPDYAGVHQPGWHDARYDRPVHDFLWVERRKRERRAVLATPAIEPETDADGDPVRPDPHSEDWYDGYAEAQRERDAATPAIEPGIDEERLADAFHAKVCGPFATIDPQQCVGGRDRDVRIAAAIAAAYRATPADRERPE